MRATKMINAQEQKKNNEEETKEQENEIVLKQDFLGLNFIKIEDS